MDSDHNYYLALNLPPDAYVRTESELGVKLDGTEPFTIGTWIKLYSLGMHSSVISKEGTVDFGIEDDRIYFEFAGGPHVTGSTADLKLDAIEWHYLSASYDRQFLRLYIDGVNVATSGMVMDGQNTANPFLVGNNLYGKMRCLLVYNEGLSSEQIMENMFNEPVRDGLVCELDFMQNPSLDTVTPARTLYLEEGASMVEVHPSLMLQGMAYVVPTQGTRINPGGSMVDSYTVQTHLCVNSPESVQIIFANNLPESDAGMAIYLEYDAQAGGMRVNSLRGTDFNPEMTLQSNSIIKAGRWVNIATVYDGENLSIYIDGVKDATGKFGPILNTSTEGNPMIGGRRQPGSYIGYQTLQGNISTMEVWEIALSDEQIEAYSRQSPDYQEEGLSGYFDFTTPHSKNEVLDAPLALCDGALTMDKTEPLGDVKSEWRGYAKAKADYHIDDALLSSFRSEVDFDQWKQKYLVLLKNVSEKELEELGGELNLPDIAVVKEKLKSKWKDFIESGQLDFIVTHHIVGTDFVLVVHKSEYSYVAYKAPVYKIDECVMRKVQLVFLIVGCVMKVFFGLSAKLTDKAVRFINDKVLKIPKISTLLSEGESMTATLMFKTLSILLESGMWKDLLILIIDIGFWGIIRLIAKLGLLFMGLGAAKVITQLVSTAALFAISYAEYVKVCKRFPKVAVESIKFNHNPNNNINSAMNLRRNLNEVIRIPEWTAQYSEPAGYIRTVVNAGEVFIQARFTIGKNWSDSVQIRANALDENILGDIAVSTTGTFYNGVSLYVDLMLPFNNLINAPVGTYDIGWQWQYLDVKTDLWVNMEQTRHRIYIVQGDSLAPWGQNYTQPGTWPWADALDVACRWGEGAQNEQEVRERLTLGMNGSGCVYNGNKHYHIKGDNRVTVYYTEFLKDLVILPHPEVECSDCSVFLTIFSRLLGVPLLELYIANTHAPYLHTAYLKSIGNNEWETHEWEYHQVAVLAGMDNLPPKDYLIYDACIHVSASGNPWGGDGDLGDGFVPGSPGHEMYFSERPLNDPIMEDIPYGNVESYRERLLQNNVNEKQVTIHVLIEQYEIT